MKEDDMLRKLYSEISSCRKCCSDEEIGPIISGLDKFLFLPPRLEKGVRKYIFITMEPTDSWCDSRKDGEKLISEGMANFYYSDRLQSRRGPIILQFVAQKFLCNNGETYLITDLGKCSMPTDNKKEKIFTTSITREKRFYNCGHWIKNELDIVNPELIYFVGGSVEKYFNNNSWYMENKLKCKTIYHYANNYAKFDEYYNNNRDDYGKFYNDNSGIQILFDKFIEDRKSEINNDISVKYGSNAHNKLMESLDHIKKLTEVGDRKMIFYYWSVFKKLQN